MGIKLDHLTLVSVAALRCKNLSDTEGIAGE